VIPRVVLLAASFATLLPFSALAQLQVYEFNGTTDTPVVGTLNVGTTSAGATIATRFHVRNTGSAPVVLQTVSLAGAGFTITAAPSLPYTLAPYTGLASEPEIDVDFSPTIVASYSAFFVINTINMILKGTAVPSEVLTVGSSTTPLSPGGTVSFGSVDVGSAQTQGFVLSNVSVDSITVATLTVSGAGFAGPIGLTAPLPLQLGPGQAAAFQVSFTPQSGTLAQGVLTVGQQMFNLAGQGLDPPSLGQLQLFVFNGTTDTPAGALVNVGTFAPGDAITTRFHVRNIGQGSVTLGNASLSGGDGGFSIASEPSVGYILAPYTVGSAEPEIDVAFSSTVVDSFRATLGINGASVILTGAVVPLAVVTVGGSTTPLAAGATVDFSAAVGSDQVQAFVLSNPSSASVTVGSVAVSGTGFTLAPGLTLPVQIAPDGPSVPFQVTFTPTTGATVQGTLTVDTRTFNLTGQGLDLPLPSATIVLLPTAGASGQQDHVSISLAPASKVNGTGTLTMAFQSSVNGVSDDPAIQFLSGPQRVASLSIVPGDTSATFGVDGASSMTFQTGATAGTITFTLTLNGQTKQAAQATLTIPPSRINLADDTFSAIRLFGSLNVSFGGIDNTYSASHVAFTFYDTTGLPLPQGAIDVDETSGFQTYFSTTQAGGAFQMLAEFPVTGNTALIGSVTAQITNSQGTVTTPSIPFGN
jgi:hypothetical protein